MPPPPALSKETLGRPTEQRGAQGHLGNQPRGQHAGPGAEEAGGAGTKASGGEPASQGRCHRCR